MAVGWEGVLLLPLNSLHTSPNAGEGGAGSLSLRDQSSVVFLWGALICRVCLRENHGDTVLPNMDCCGCHAPLL